MRYSKYSGRGNFFSLPNDAYAAPTVQPDRRRWCIVTAGMVHGDRRCGAPGRHAENYSGMPLRLRMDSPSIWMV